MARCLGERCLPTWASYSIRACPFQVSLRQQSRNLEICKHFKHSISENGITLPCTSTMSQRKEAKQINWEVSVSHIEKRYSDTATGNRLHYFKKPIRHDVIKDDIPLLQGSIFVSLYSQTYLNNLILNHFLKRWRN